MMKILGVSQIRDLTAEAAATPRKRKNLNFHDGHDDAIQRMFNALEPETYVRPHRHPEQWEMFVLVSGACILLTFDGDGTVCERFLMDEGAVRAVELPAGTWHSVVSRRTGTVVMEVKPGPYLPTSLEDFGPWSPTEGTLEANVYRDGMRRRD